jgi:predicted phage tail protein
LGWYEHKGLAWRRIVGIATLGGIRVFNEVMWMDIFTARGLKLLLTTFVVSFLLGGVTAIIGFTLVVDLMAK